MKRLAAITVIVFALLGFGLLAGAAAAHTTSYRTTSSFGYAESSPQGWLGSINTSGGNPACTPGRRVTLFKVRTGRDAQIGSDVSGRPAGNGAGFWQVETRLRPGRYFAKVKAKNIGPRGHDHTCKAYRTSKLRYPLR